MHYLKNKNIRYEYEVVCNTWNMIHIRYEYEALILKPGTSESTRTNPKTSPNQAETSQIKPNQPKTRIFGFFHLIRVDSGRFGRKLQISTKKHETARNQATNFTKTWNNPNQAESCEVSESTRNKRINLNQPESSESSRINPKHAFWLFHLIWVDSGWLIRLIRLVPGFSINA